MSKIDQWIDFDKLVKEDQFKLNVLFTQYEGFPLDEDFSNFIKSVKHAITERLSNVEIFKREWMRLCGSLLNPFRDPMYIYFRIVNHPLFVNVEVLQCFEMDYLFDWRNKEFRIPLKLNEIRNPADDWIKYPFYEIAVFY